jgi:adenylate cyclase
MYNWKVVLLTIALLVTVRVMDPKLIEQFRLNYFDSLQSYQESVKADNIVIVDIDEKALNKYGQFPFSRDVYADWLNKAPENNVYVFNMGFTENDRFGKDHELAISMAERDVILSSFVSNYKISDKPVRGFGKLGKGNPSDWLYSYNGIRNPVIGADADGVGTVTVAPSVDGIVRESPLAILANGHLYPSVALEVLRVYEFQPNLAIKIKEAGVEWVRMGSLPPMYTTENSNVQIAYWNEYERISFGDPLPNDKIVILGLSAGGLVNPVATPTGAMLPHDIQAHLLSTVVNGIQIQRPWYASQLELLILLTLSVLILLIVYRTPTYVSAIASISLLITNMYLGYYYWMESLLLIDVLYPTMAAFIVFTHATFNRFYVTYKLKEQIKGQFGTYLSPDMVYMLQKDPSLLKLGGERKEMSFLFMDIVGFTPISEHYKNNDDPEGLVELVNEFLDAMTKIILNNGGTIDKYMGDCIMAFWNSPLPCDNHAEMAVKSAIEIEAKTNELKELYSARGLPDINVGTGVNTGDCIVGNMGSESRFDYSVIGDAVNLAARLEATAARHEYVEYKTIISSYTMEQLPPGYKCDKIGDIKVKGKDELISIYFPSCYDL